MTPSASDPRDAAPAVGFVGLEGGGETGTLLRQVNWSQTAVGPIAGWPQSLKTTVGIILQSRHPMFLWWGPELTQFYNDAYMPSFGAGRHPRAMGQAGRECWSEIWPIIGPQIEAVMTRGQPSWNEDHLVPIFRNGRLEEVYWTYGYSPVFREEGTVGGTLVVCTETTSREVAQRRQISIRRLAEKTPGALTSAELLRSAAEVFAQAPADIPFALIYRLDRRAGTVQLMEALGLDAAQTAALDQGAHWAEHARVDDAAAAPPLPVTASVPLPGGPWPEPASQVFVSPLGSATVPSWGFVVFGLSSRLPFNQDYRDYLNQLTQHLSSAQGRLEAFLARTVADAERTNLLLQAPVATALLIGPEHIFQLANKLYCQLVGRFELVGKTYREAFPELVGTALPTILDHVYQSGEPFVSSEYAMTLARGIGGALQDCFIKFNLEPLHDATGHVYGMMAVALDITDQVQERRVLEKSQAERERLLADLEAASRAKDEFLAMLGHELRNPLSPIVTALQLMRLRDGDQISSEQKTIERQVNHLVRLVDDLLDVSRITRGKVELKRELVEVSEVLTKAVEMASFLFEQRSHQLTISVPRTGLRWDGDPTRLAQAVANLLTNAARYTEIGGHIQLGAAREGHELVIRVKDNGIGISAELLPHIFDLFVQGRRSFDRAEGGLGIGLTLVKNLVTLHGGVVTGTSDGPGQGSEFTIRLPSLEDPQVARPAAPAAPVARKVTSRRVLVVDDNADAADLLADLLRTVGHQVALACDPLTALNLIADFKPEVAVLDIGLPVMDGYELATRMRAQLGPETCRLIALTGYGQDHDRRRSAEVGFAHHLVKPVDVSTLLRLIVAP